MLGLPVHETKLGIYKSFSNNTNSIKDYLVVACKNFKIDKDDKFYSFLEVLNNFDPDTNDIDNNNLDLETTLLLLKNNKIIDDIPLKFLSKNIKKFYKESFKYGVKEVLKTVYDKLLNSKNE